MDLSHCWLGVPPPSCAPGSQSTGWEGTTELQPSNNVSTYDACSIGSYPPSPVPHQAWSQSLVNQSEHSLVYGQRHPSPLFSSEQTSCNPWVTFAQPYQSVHMSHYQHHHQDPAHPLASTVGAQTSAPTVYLSSYQDTRSSTIQNDLPNHLHGWDDISSSHQAFTSGSDLGTTFYADLHLEPLLPIPDAQAGSHVAFSAKLYRPIPVAFSSAELLSPSAVVQGNDYFSQHLPPDRFLVDLARFIAGQPWFQTHNQEPPLHEDEEVVKEGHLPSGSSHSRFDLFFEADDRHRCLWIVKGKRCHHRALRLGRARGHAHSHFDYKPFMCEGGCGNPECRERYTCVDFLRDHMRRTRDPMRTCTVCGRTVTVQNLKRHMRLHE